VPPRGAAPGGADRARNGGEDPEPRPVVERPPVHDQRLDEEQDVHAAIVAATRYSLRPNRLRKKPFLLGASASAATGITTATTVSLSTVTSGSGSRVSSASGYSRRITSCNSPLSKNSPEHSVQRSSVTPRCMNSTILPPQRGQVSIPGRRSSRRVSSASRVASAPSSSPTRCCNCFSA